MKWKKWLENWDMTSLKIKAGFLEIRQDAIVVLKSDDPALHREVA